MSRLSDLFNCQRVAIIGASEKSYWTRCIVQRFQEYGFAGHAYAINRRGAPVFGLPGYARCTDVPEPIESAYICVPADGVIAAVEDAATAGARSAIVLSSGFSEAGAEEGAMEARLVARARELGVVLLGPNSLGFANVSARSVMSVIEPRLPILEGAVALVSQSGAVVQQMVRFAYQQGIGLSFIAATGNEAMVGLADVADMLVDHAETRVIAIFAEGIKDPETFKNAARRAREAGKAIVILKVGRSEISASVAAAHTGSLVGDDAVFDAICRQYGIIRIASIEEMIVTASLIATCGPLSKPGIGVVSISGGACGMFADLAEPAGVALPTFSPGTAEALAKILPSYARVLNPLDITGAAVSDKTLWGKAIWAVAGDPQIGLLVIMLGVAATPEEYTSYTHLDTGMKEAIDALGDRKHLFISQIIQPHTEASAAYLEVVGNPNVAYGLEHVVRGLGHLSRWSVDLARKLPEIRSIDRVEHRPTGEYGVLRFLESQGVPIVPIDLARSGDEAADFARRANGRVVMKVASREIVHKTEVGGVRLNLSGADADEVRSVFDEMMHHVAEKVPGVRIDGALIAPMREGGVEMFVGVKRDPIWGAVLALGMGGIWVELLGDVALRPLPIGREDARAMMDELRGAALLRGYRGAAPANLDALADVIVRIGEVALALDSSLVALEINPLLVRGDVVEALDGLAVWETS